MRAKVIQINYICQILLFSRREFLFHVQRAEIYSNVYKLIGFGQWMF